MKYTVEAKVVFGVSFLLLLLAVKQGGIDATSALWLDAVYLGTQLAILYAILLVVRFVNERFWPRKY